MKHIELHILQSFPVSCLNRDDVGSPKAATFGGAPRARVSSQCLKRAARMLARELSPHFSGLRTRYIKQPFLKELLAAGLDQEQATAKANEICEVFSKKKDDEKVTTAVYLSPEEISQIARAVASGEDTKKAARKASRLDAGDIALFGRMVANDASLNVEGASMFSHALSTHKASNEIDFYTAVDDAKPDDEDAGASMMGALEYNAATYYRFVAINLDLLNAETHLGPLGSDQKRAILDAFVRAVLMAVPNARKNSMNAGTLPSEALVTVRESGAPIQLVNAFENPVVPNGKGIVAQSITRMKDELARMKEVWGIEYAEELWLSENKLAGILSTISKYV